MVFYNNVMTVMLLPALLYFWGDFPGALHTPVLGDKWFLLCAFFRHATPAPAVDALCTEPACQGCRATSFMPRRG